MRVIGITGGVGAGKSEILAYIKEHYHCQIILADKVAHEIEKPGQPCYEKLVALLGKEILNPDGTIHKAKMAEKIFAQKTILAKVNQIVHPAVKEFILKEITDRKTEDTLDFLFIEAALLIECGYSEIVDELWYIYAKMEVRRERLKQSRAYSEEKINQIVQGQLSEEEFKKHCKVMIDNSGSLLETYQQIDEKLGAYLCQK